MTKHESFYLNKWIYELLRINNNNININNDNYNDKQKYLYKKKNTKINKIYQKCMVSFLKVLNKKQNYLIIVYKQELHYLFLNLINPREQQKPKLLNQIKTTTILIM